mmetsp:Transcript_6709/g.19358  ORF Transcript_6709/g.19358 Transcript_6709/m.19358 type:complete len:127 (+) Transcript_6709:154-534(+)
MGLIQNNGLAPAIFVGRNSKHESGLHGSSSSSSSNNNIHDTPCQTRPDHIRAADLCNGCTPEYSVDYDLSRNDHSLSCLVLSFLVLSRRSTRCVALRRVGSHCASEATRKTTVDRYQDGGVESVAL